MSYEDYDQRAAAAIKQTLRIGILCFGFIVCLWLYFSSVFWTQTGEVTLIFNSVSGLKNEVFREGAHFKNPFLERAVTYDIKEHRYDIKTVAASKDLQDVTVDLTFLYAPMPERVPNIHKTFGPEYENRVFPPICQEVLKSVISENTAEQVITKRQIVSENIKQRIIERARQYDILVKEVALADVDFSAEFTHAVERKQVAEQELETSKRVAQAAVAKAEGEAKAAQIINQASQTSPAFLELRRLETAEKIASTLAHSQNVIYLPSNTTMLLQAKGK